MKRKYTIYHEEQKEIMKELLYYLHFIGVLDPMNSLNDYRSTHLRFTDVEFEKIQKYIKNVRTDVELYDTGQ